LITQGDIIRFDNGCIIVGDRRYETTAVGPMLRTTRRLKEGEYFVMGDNEPDSFDSRYWGSVPYDNIIGKVLFV